MKAYSIHDREVGYCQVREQYLDTPIATFVCRYMTFNITFIFSGFGLYRRPFVNANARGRDFCRPGQTHARLPYEGDVQTLNGGAWPLHVSTGGFSARAHFRPLRPFSVPVNPYQPLREQLVPHALYDIVANTLVVPDHGLLPRRRHWGHFQVGLGSFNARQKWASRPRYGRSHSGEDLFFWWL